MTYICVYIVKEHINVANFNEHLTLISSSVHRYVCMQIRFNGHVNVVSGCKQRMRLWGPVPSRANQCSAAHTNSTRMRIDKRTQTPLRTKQNSAVWVESWLRYGIVPYKT